MRPHDGRELPAGPNDVGGQRQTQRKIGGIRRLQSDSHHVHDERRVSGLQAPEPRRVVQWGRVDGVPAPQPAGQTRPRAVQAGVEDEEDVHDREERVAQRLQQDHLERHSPQDQFETEH